MLLACNNNQHVTFPLRAAWVLPSWSALMRLLMDKRMFSFTIWGRIDHDTRTRLQLLLPAERVFYDVQTPRDVTHWKLIDGNETKLAQCWDVFKAHPNSVIQRDQSGQDEWTFGGRCWLLSKASYVGTPQNPLVTTLAVSFNSTNNNSRVSVLIRTLGLFKNPDTNGNVSDGINCWITRSGDMRLSTHHIEPEQQVNSSWEEFSIHPWTASPAYVVTVKDYGVLHSVHFSAATTNGTLVGNLELAFPWRPEGGFVVVNTHESTTVRVESLTIEIQ